ncbi:hypothetical protein JHK82_047787 [Glycine max]|nr:hypothetical protein JHK82_047787 [Glycine max]
MCVKGGWWGKMVTSEEPFPVVDGKGLSNSMVNLVIRVCDSGQGYKGTNNEFESFSSQQGEQNEKADDDEDITSKGEDDEYDEDVDGSGDQVEEYEEYEDDDEHINSNSGMVELLGSLLEQFLEAMNGKSPSSIITDGDVAMKNSIKRVFLSAHHRLCA